MSKNQAVPGAVAKARGRVTLSNWRQAPFSRWAFHHVRELIPTADIPNDPATARSYPVQAVDFSDLSIRDGIRFNRALELTDTDGLIFLHRGVLVCEFYDDDFGAETPHILMSVSKSLLGLLSGILVDRGQLDADAVVSDILPELATTAYAGVTVRNLLDMRAGVAFEENYLAASGPIIAYRKATNWNAIDPGETASDLRSFFQEMRDSAMPHGGPFNYVSPNTDLLGLIIEHVTGRRYADMVSDLIWKPSRAWRNAYITVDRLGAPRCAGGFCATLRDVARVGQLVAQNGAIDGVQVVPPGWLFDIAHKGDAAAWSAAAFSETFPGRRIHYRSQWYVQTGDDPILFALGIHGQWLLVDPIENIVMAKLSSQDAPLDADKISLTLEMFERVREHLRG